MDSNGKYTIIPCMDGMGHPPYRRAQGERLPRLRRPSLCPQGAEMCS